MCAECATIATAPVNQRLLYMVLWQNECERARARYAWLILQERRGRPYARPMPDDPEPHFWPSTERKPASSGTLSLIQRVKQAYRIEDIAEKHTRLRGNSVLKGKCFLHGETHGEAFTIWVDEQRWKCFGQCNTGGDVLDLFEAMDDRGLNWRNS